MSNIDGFADAVDVDDGGFANADVENPDDRDARDFRERYMARGGYRRPSPPASELPGLRRRLAELDAATPTGARAQARTRRDTALQALDAEERNALAGVADQSIIAATREHFRDRRAAIERQHQVADTQARRREDVRSSSRAGVNRVLAVGIEGDPKNVGLLGREVQRRRREIDDREQIDLASARSAEVENERWGRHVALQQGVRDRANAARADLDRWATQHGEAWALQQVEQTSRERVDARDAAQARQIADERVEILGRIAAIEAAQAAEHANGNGSTTT